jgi:sporulation-control protein spo0M
MKTKRYTLGTNDIIKINGVDIYLDENQVIKIVKSFGATFFECPYSDEFYFIECNDVAHDLLQKQEFVDFIEDYNESIFKVDKLVYDAKLMLEDLYNIKTRKDYSRTFYDNKIEQIQSLLDKLKDERD